MLNRLSSYAFQNSALAEIAFGVNRHRELKSETSLQRVYFVLHFSIPEYSEWAWEYSGKMGSSVSDKKIVHSPPFAWESSGGKIVHGPPFAWKRSGGKIVCGPPFAWKRSGGKIVHSPPFAWESSGGKIVHGRHHLLGKGLAGKSCTAHRLTSH